MQTVPKGSTPPAAMLKAGARYHGCSGMCRAIWLVRSGTGIASRLKPKKEPTKTSGVETPNQSSISESSVVSGAAVEEPQ